MYVIPNITDRPFGTSILAELVLTRRRTIFAIFVAVDAVDEAYLGGNWGL